MITLYRWSFAGLAAAALLVAAGVNSAPGARPNLIFVNADQLSGDMLGCYGNRDVQSPNLDRLASQGVRFRNCVSNSPVCTPYRGILLSGQHPLNNGAMENDLQMLPGHGNYLGEVLRDGGYHTGYYGKWHLYGGDRVRGIPAGPYRYGFDDEFVSNNCTLWFDAARAYYWDQDGKTKELYGDWEPYAQTRQAMSFIDRHHAEPFALFLSWHPPHWDSDLGREGYDAPAELRNRYDPAKLTLRPTVKDTPQIRRMYQGYYGNITGIDRAFGWLMDKLDEYGLTEDTIVIFTADHGDLLMSYNWPNNKGRAEDGSCRVPLLVRWPKRLKPGTTDLLLGTFDLMPTILGLANLPIPDTCQGRDASDAIVRGYDDGVDALPLFFLPLSWRGVYTHRYTYSEALHAPAEANVRGGAALFNILYDRETDPAETRNRFDDPQYAAVRATLHQQTHALMGQFGDPGWPYREVLKRTVRPEDFANVTRAPAKRPVGWEGRLKGPPVDLLNPRAELRAPSAQTTPAGTKDAKL